MLCAHKDWALSFLIGWSLVKCTAITVCNAQLPEADCSQLDSGKIAHKVFLSSRPTILKGIGDNFLQEGGNYLHSELLHDKTYLRLSARGYPSLYIDHIPPTDAIFLPIPLECIRKRLLFVGFYMLANDEESLLRSTCGSVDKIHCLVEGHATADVKIGRKESSVTLQPGQCVFVPHGQSVTVTGGCLLATWMWSPLDKTTFDSQQCSKQARHRVKLQKRKLECTKKSAPICATIGDELAYVGVAAEELFMHYLTTAVCPGLSGAQEQDFVQLLQREFSQIVGNEKLRSVVHSCWEAMMKSGVPDCGSTDTISAAQRLGSEFADQGVGVTADYQAVSPLCRTSMEGSDSQVTYATHRTGPKSAADGEQTVSFFKHNTNSTPVYLLDGPVQPEVFFSQFATPSTSARPVVLKGMARRQPAYRRWRDKYLVRKLMKSSSDISSESVPMLLDTLLEANDSLLNGQLPQQLWGDVVVPSPLCHSAVQQRLFRGSIKTEINLDLTIVDDLQLETFDQLVCQLDGYSNFVLIAPEHSDAIPLRSGERRLQVNLDSVNSDMYEALLSVPWMSAKVEPGDCIYVPSRWFHYATYHNRTLVLGFNWNSLPQPFANWPQASEPANCSFDGSTLSTAEDFRYQLLEAMNGLEGTLQELTLAMEQELEILDAATQALVLFEAGDSNSDSTLTDDEILSVSGEVIDQIISGIDDSESSPAAGEENLQSPDMEEGSGTTQQDQLSDPDSQTHHEL